MAVNPELAEEVEGGGGDIAEHPDQKPTKTRRGPVIGVLQILVVVGLVGGALMYARAPDAPAAAAGPGASPAAANAAAPLVAVIRPSPAAHQVRVESTGSAAVRSYVDLVPQVSGRVVETSPSLRNGGEFDAGEVLIRLERRDFELALAQAEADVDSARADLELRQAESAAAIRNYDLLNPGKPVPPLVAKRPQIAQAEARLAAAIARRDVAATNLERTTYTLPFGGRIVSSSAEAGQTLTAGQPFGRGYALDTVEVVVSLSPADLSRLAPVQGRPVRMIADGDVREGVVDRLAAERDSRSRFTRAFIRFVDGAPPLVPGTFVTVEIDGPTVSGTLALPESAVQVGDSAWVVMDGELRAQPLQIIGRTDGGFIVEGFDIGAGVVAGAVPAAREGLAVRVQEADGT